MLTRVKGWFKWRFVFLGLVCLAVPLIATVWIATSVTQNKGVAVLAGLILGALWGKPVAMAFELAYNERPGGRWDFD